MSEEKEDVVESRTVDVSVSDEDFINTLNQVRANNQSKIESVVSESDLANLAKRLNALQNRLSVLSVEVKREKTSHEVAIISSIIDNAMRVINVEDMELKLESKNIINKCLKFYNSILDNDL